MFNFGVFSDLLKIARVVPIFKMRDKKLVENCRPISILSSISKVLEKLLKFRILSFLNKHDVFYNRQNGFRKKFCIVYPILDILTDRGGVLEDVRGFDDVLEDIFSSPWPRSRRSSKIALSSARGLERNLETFYGLYLHLAERCCENLRSARGLARC